MGPAAGIWLTDCLINYYILCIGRCTAILIWAVGKCERKRVPIVINSPEEFDDPIIQLLGDLGGSEQLDDYIAHLVSLSDIVKSDMRKSMEWDTAVINRKLCDAVAHQLDRNGRYRERPIEATAAVGEKFSQKYVECQCLLTEWLAVYRALRAYCHIQVRAFMAKKAAAEQQETAAGA